MDLPSREDVVPDLDKPPKLYADPSELLEYRFGGAWRAMVMRDLMVVDLFVPPL